MTADEVKRNLRELKERQKVLKRAMEYIANERRIAENIRGLNFDKISVRTSIVNSTEELYVKCIDRIIEVERRFKEAFEEMARVEDLIIERMSRLNPQEYDAIMLRYIFGLSVLKTASIMGYSEDNIKKLQQSAYKKMADN